MTKISEISIYWKAIVRKPVLLPQHEMAPLAIIFHLIKLLRSKPRLKFGKKILIHN